MTDTAQDLRSALEPCPDCGGTTDTCMGAVIHADRCPVIAAWNRRALAAPATDDPVGAAQMLAAEERDALLSALGWKTGPFLNEGTRKVVLEDSAALRPEMVKARRRADDAEADRDLWRFIAGERVEEARSGLLIRVWKQMKDERRRRIKAEVALAHPPAAEPVGLREDQVEAAALAFAKEFYGPAFDQCANPEAYDLAKRATRSVFAALEVEQ